VHVRKKLKTQNPQYFSQLESLLCKEVLISEIHEMHGIVNAPHKNAGFNTFISCVPTPAVEPTLNPRSDEGS
jgi:hypothetical protein